jgi:integrase
MRRQPRADDNTVRQFTAALRHATPEMIEMALKALMKNGTKRRKKASRFKGTDHWLTPQQFSDLCEASSPFYSLLWKTCLGHALRISECLAIRPCDIENGFLTVTRLKHGQKTIQPLMVDLSSLIATGSYRVFPVHRSSAFLAFRRAGKAIGLRPDLCHPHVLRHTAVQMLLRAGTPLHVASQYVGHTSLTSTSQYLNCGDAQASAAAAAAIGPAVSVLPCEG